MPLFVHAADIHLDSPLRGLAKYEGAPADAIRGATRRAFEKLIDLAIERKAAFVLMAGDLYDGDWKDYNTALFFNRQMAKLDRAGIRAFVVKGNHDAQSVITRSLRPPSNTHMFNAKRPETIALPDIGVALHGQSYATQAVSEDLSVNYPPPTPGLLNIGLLHTSLDGRPGHEPYAPCTLEALRAKGYHYWALGHIHTREVVSADPYIVFPGCIQGRHIRESGDKGCTLVQFEHGEISAIEHHAVDVMRWTACHVSLEAVEDEAAFSSVLHRQVRGALDKAGDRLVAIRVFLEGETPLHRRLQADPIHFENLVRSVGIEIDDERVWIEKVIVRTRDPRRVADALAEGSPLSRIVDAIVAYPSTLEDGSRLHEEIAALRSKIPDAFRRSAGEEGFDPDDPEAMARLIERAKEHVLARLLSGEYDQ